MGAPCTCTTYAEGPCNEWLVTSLSMAKELSVVTAPQSFDLAAMPVATQDLVSYIVDLDGDRDGLQDAWETTFGLDPSTLV
jgi:hypothetical protein